MKKLFLFLFTCLPLLMFAQNKPDWTRTPNGPNTIVDWNVKFKTLIVPHGTSATIAGSQDTTGHVYMVLNPGVDTSFYMYVGGSGFVNVARNFIKANPTAKQNVYSWVRRAQADTVQGLLYNAQSLNGTTANGLQLVNPNAATSGNQVQVSPAWYMKGSALIGGTSSQTLEMRGYITPSVGSTSIAGTYYIDENLNGSGWGHTFSVNTAGQASFTTLATQNATFSGTADAAGGTGRNILANVQVGQTANNDVLVGYDFASTFSAGTPILTTTNLIGGSGYVDGTYTNVTLVDNNNPNGRSSAANAKATITVSGGTVTSVTVTYGGSRYAVNDVMTASNLSLGGTGSGFSFQIASLGSYTGGKYYAFRTLNAPPLFTPSTASYGTFVTPAGATYTGTQDGTWSYNGTHITAYINGSSQQIDQQFANGFNTNGLVTITSASTTNPTLTVSNTATNQTALEIPSGIFKVDAGAQANFSGNVTFSGQSVITGEFDVDSGGELSFFDFGGVKRVYMTNDGTGLLFHLQNGSSSRNLMHLDTTANGQFTDGAGHRLLTTADISGGGIGTVTNVSSANSDISVATGTSTPVLTLANVNGRSITYYDPTSSIQTQLNGKQASLSGTGYIKQSGTSSSYIASIPNTDLANSSITVQGTSTPLGGSVNPINGTGFVKASGTTISYDNSTYLTTATAASTYQAALSGTGFVKVTGSTVSYDNSTYLTTSAAASTYLSSFGKSDGVGIISTIGGTSTAPIYTPRVDTSVIATIYAMRDTINSNGATAGSGIVFTGGTVSVDQTYAYTWTGKHIFQGSVRTSGNISAAAGGNSTLATTVGDNLDFASATYVDNSTAASGTLAFRAGSVFHAPTLSSANTGITNTVAATVAIDGAPAAGSNTTLSSIYSLYIASGNLYAGGGFATSSGLNGNLTGGAGGGTFSSTFTPIQNFGSTSSSYRVVLNGTTASQLPVGDGYVGTVIAAAPIKLGTSGNHPGLSNFTVSSLGTVSLTGSTTVTQTYNEYIAGVTATVGTNGNFSLYVAGQTFTTSPIFGSTVAAINSTATATAAQLAGGTISSTSAAATSITLPTATAFAAVIGAKQGVHFPFTIDNVSGANTVTVVVNTGITAASAVTGGTTLTVSSGQRASFDLYYNSTTTAVLSRRD